MSTEHTPEAETGELVPVDPPEHPKTIHATALSVRDTERRPIVPAWARNREEARQLAAWLARYGIHVSVYHLTRSPKYGAKLLGRVPAGAWFALVTLHGWVFDTEARPLRADAVTRKDLAGYLTLSKQRNRRVRQRLALLGAAPVGFLVVLVVVWVARVATAAPGSPAPGFWPSPPGWAVLLGAALALAVLGKLGTPADRRVTDVATVTAAAPPRLTAEVVTRALQALGIAALTAKGATISYVAPITRDGPGWRADVDLPFGVTVGDIMERRDRLASGLRRPLGCVWPEAKAEEHEGRLVLWVGDRDMAQQKPAPWPLAKRGSVTLFDPIPFGVDQRGRPVAMTLMFESVLIGAKPRMGKTFALRVLVLAGALDVNTELRLFELKGTGDLSTIEGCCHRYASGADTVALEAAMASLREVYADLDVRAGKIRSLPRAVCPENKVTPEISARRSLGLHPVLLGIDECQELFSHPDYGKEAERLCEAIIKRGPALGIVLILATQRPDAKSLPTGVSANVGIRFCLRVMGQVENDMILGTSSYRNGIRATTFTARDRGIGYLAGVADDPLITRTAYIDGPEAEKIAERARAAREAAGTLSGHALGEQPERDDRSLLDDLATVFATITVDKVWSETVIEKLAELDSGRYGRMSPEALTAAVKPYGLTTGQVHGRLPTGGTANRRGLTREDVQAALDRYRRELTV
ncbi:cell division protein FtsK [Pseudonocardia xishanensis]|uniref:FtsK/SpoIIIE domain-containing protein n=1 Tax=Pseudonocardia xishanensis TaxID=630995 RepID=A0ABP8RZW5_9PSEU